MSCFSLHISLCFRAWGSTLRSLSLKSAHGPWHCARQAEGPRVLELRFDFWRLWSFLGFGLGFGVQNGRVHMGCGGRSRVLIVSPASEGMVLIVSIVSDAALAPSGRVRRGAGDVRIWQGY